MPTPTKSGPKPADAGVLRHKQYDCQFKSLDDTGRFEVYAAAFNNVDRQGDVIVPGAFVDLDQFVRDGWGALNHISVNLPVAWIETADQDDKGLKVTGKFHSTPEAQACRTVILERIAAGKSVKCSIGYIIIDSAMETRDGKMVQLLKKVQVFEFSFVNLPANPQAELVSAKSLNLDTFDTLDLEDAMAKETGVIEALKTALGLSTKGGRKMSGATLEKMKSFAKAMDEHGDKCVTAAKEMNEKCKGLKGFGEAHKAMADEFCKCLKEFEAGKVKDDDEDEDEDEDGEKEFDEDEEGDEEETKPGKNEKPEDTADGDPPKGSRGKRLTDEDVARSVYRDQLKGRGLAGRRIDPCP